MRLQHLVIEKSGKVPLEEFELPAFHDRLQRARQAATWRSFFIFENALSAARGSGQSGELPRPPGAGPRGLPLVLGAGAAPSLITHLRRGEEQYALRRSQTPAQRRVDYLVQLLTDREAAKELRLYQLGRFLIDEWHRAALAPRDERLRLARSSSSASGRPGPGRAVAGGRLALLFWQSVEGVVSLGGFVALMQAATGFQGQLVAVLRQMGNLYEESLYLGDLKAFVQYERVEEGREPAAARAAVPDRLRERELRLSRRAGGLEGSLSFTIYPGEKVALIGTNGAGKTTLVKLLLGLYQPTRGRILIDGKDLRTLDPESHRRPVAAVFQDYLRYQLTARDNVGFRPGRAAGRRPGHPGRGGQSGRRCRPRVSSLRDSIRPWAGRLKAGRTSPAASGKRSPSPGHTFATPGSWCWTSLPRRWTPGRSWRSLSSFGPWPGRPDGGFRLAPHGFGPHRRPHPGARRRRGSSKTGATTSCWRSGGEYARMFEMQASGTAAAPRSRRRDGAHKRPWEGRAGERVLGAGRRDEGAANGAAARARQSTGGRRAYPLKRRPCFLIPRLLWAAARSAPFSTAVLWPARSWG